MIGTVRWRIIEVAGRVIRKARQIYKGMFECGEIQGILEDK